MVNPDSVQWVEDSSIYLRRGAILPVGHVVYADLTKDETFLQQIEFIQPLSRRISMWICGEMVVLKAWKII